MPSTTHHVERGVGFGADLHATSKRELKLSHYAMASNEFRGDVARPDTKDDDQDDDTVSVASGEEKPKRGDGRGKHKAVDLERLVRKVDDDLKQLKEVDGSTYDADRKRIGDAISGKSGTYLKERSDEKKAALLAQMDEISEVALRLEAIEGWDVPPTLNGMFRFSDLRKNIHMEEMKQELMYRQVDVLARDTFTVLKTKLRQD